MSGQKQTLLSELNTQEWDEFVDLLGNVVEHNSMCASAVWGNKPFSSLDSLQNAFAEFLDHQPQQGKEGVLRLFPDLAGKLCQSGDLTSESQKEHAAAGLDQITEEERAEMADLNNRYKQKFGIPFVICARENKVKSILDGLQQRLENTKSDEVITGIGEVKKICNLRIRDLVVEERQANL